MKNSAASFQWKDLVIGSCIESIRFAHEHKFFLLKNAESHYHSYEGIQEEWARKVYDLYNIGKTPITERITSIRVNSEQKDLKIFTEYGHFTAEYENLHLFSMDNIFGLEQEANTTLVGYRVLDWFDVRAMGVHDLDEIILGDDFINNIRFFKTCRLDGNQPYKDLVCESFLTEKQLKSVDFTDTMARFKTLSILEERGLGKPKLELWKRDVYPIKETIYKEQNSIYWRR